MPSKRHSRKSHSRKRRHIKSRAYGRRRRSMYGGDKNVYFVAAWQDDSSLQPHEAKTLKLDSSKAKAQLGWGPRWNLEIALNKTLVWHKAWKQASDMATISVQHIQEYESSESV